MSTKQTEALKLAQDWYDSGNENPDDFANMIKQVIALADQPAQQGCMRCNTPKKCALYGCSPLTWPAEQPAQQQEPVLCINPKVIDPATGKVRNGTGALTYSDEPCAGWSMPLYTSPQPNKPWVGLTAKEIDDLYCEHHDDYGYRLSATGYERAIEVKLKEKNA